MENVHAERSAGWSVLCYVGVLLVATLLNNGMPGGRRHGPQHRPADRLAPLRLLLGAWLTFPAAAFFLWFLVGSAQLSEQRAGTPGGAADVRDDRRRRDGRRLAAGGGARNRRALRLSPDMFAHDGLAGVYDAFIFTQGGLGYCAVAIFLFAAAHSMRRHESAPGWLACARLYRGVRLGDRDAFDLLHCDGLVHGARPARARRRSARSRPRFGSCAPASS